MTGSGLGLEDAVGLGLIQDMHGGLEVSGGFLGGLGRPDGLQSRADLVFLGRIPLVRRLVRRTSFTDDLMIGMDPPKKFSTLSPKGGIS